MLDFEKNLVAADERAAALAARQGEGDRARAALKSRLDDAANRDPQGPRGGGELDKEARPGRGAAPGELEQPAHSSWRGRWPRPRSATGPSSRRLRGRADHRPRWPSRAAEAEELKRRSAEELNGLTETSCRASSSCTTQEHETGPHRRQGELQPLQLGASARPTRTRSRPRTAPRRRDAVGLRRRHEEERARPRSGGSASWPRPRPAGWSSSRPPSTGGGRAASEQKEEHEAKLAEMDRRHLTRRASRANATATRWSSATARAARSRGRAGGAHRGAGRGPGRACNPGSRRDRLSRELARARGQAEPARDKYHRARGQVGRVRGPDPARLPEAARRREAVRPGQTGPGGGPVLDDGPPPSQRPRPRRPEPRHDPPRQPSPPGEEPGRRRPTVRRSNLSPACTRSPETSPGSSRARFKPLERVYRRRSRPPRWCRPSWRLPVRALARDPAPGRRAGRPARRDRARVRRRRLAHHPARRRPPARRPRPLPRPAPGAHAPAQRAADPRRPRRPGAAAARPGRGDRGRARTGARPTCTSPTCCRRSRGRRRPGASCPPVPLPQRRARRRPS